MPAPSLATNCWRRAIVCPRVHQSLLKSPILHPVCLNHNGEASLLSSGRIMVLTRGRSQREADASPAVPTTEAKQRRQPAKDADTVAVGRSHDTGRNSARGTTDVTDRSRKRPSSRRPASPIGAKARARVVGAGRLQDIEDLDELPTFEAQEVAKMREALLEWYDHNHRDLPWRVNMHSQNGGRRGRGAMGSNQFAYQVWVSEIMLQQTQVTTVIDYFNRWMTRWPTVESLAEATQEEVNYLWAGLGYYRRARFLLEGARHVVSTLGGQMPSTAKELLDIPGIGPYTAAAISSIAFHGHEAVVDGNVVRVICRLRTMGGNWSAKPLSGHITELAQQLLDPARPGDFNQAMMELGAVQCKKSGEVDCSVCPIRRLCRAHEQATVDPTTSVTSWPAKAAKVKKRTEHVWTAVVELMPPTGERLHLMVKRPETGLLAGLWEFPSNIHGEKALPGPTAKRGMDDYLAALGIVLGTSGCEVVDRKARGSFEHKFSHIHQHTSAELITVEMDTESWRTVQERVASSQKPTMRLVRSEELDRESMTSGMRKVLDLIRP